MLTLKKLVFLRRKIDMERTGFSSYWAERHGPLVASQAPFWRFTARYVQNHVLGTDDAPFDGMAISTQRDPRPTGSFTDEACYQEILVPDEWRFLDRSGSASAMVQEAVSIDRGPIDCDQGAQKRLVFLGADERAPNEDLAHAWLAAEQSPGVGRLVINRPINAQEAARLAWLMPGFAALIEIWTKSDDQPSAEPDWSRLIGGRPSLILTVKEVEIARPTTAIC
jgi:hypothetical protein